MKINKLTKYLILAGSLVSMLSQAETSEIKYNIRIKVPDAKILNNSAEPEDPKNEANSSEWLTFFHNNGYLLSINDLNQWASSSGIVSLYNTYYTNADIPSGTFGVVDIYIFEFSGNNIDHVDFFKGVKTADYIGLSKNNIVNINGLSDMEIIKSPFYVYDQPNLRDLSPLANLNKGNIQINYNWKTQYTKFPSLGSNFCNGLVNGNVKLKLYGYSIYLTAQDVCK